MYRIKLRKSVLLYAREDVRSMSPIPTQIMGDTQNTNVFDSPSSAAKRRGFKRWADEFVDGSGLSTIEEEEKDEKEERGRRSSTPVQHPTTRRGHYESYEIDRDSQPSQHTLSPSNTLP
jgi:hypothetical protein